MHGGVSIGGVVHGEAKEIGKPRQYILAYGSLMSTESRGKTGMLGRAWPVVVKGIRVGWSNVYPTATFLGAASAVTVEIRQNSTKEDHSNKGRIWEGKEERKDREKYELQGGGEDRTLAIMLEIPQDKDAQEIISAFDQREGAKYVRSRVSLNNISLWRPSAPVAAAAGISESSRYYYEDDRLPWDNREEEEEEEDNEDHFVVVVVLLLLCLLYCLVLLLLLLVLPYSYYNYYYFRVWREEAHPRTQTICG
mmetsp:Transcript_6920/g.10748  ORF Transcript_6920/g.10748 Transcript_6920/m.10748 type:complete len:251 (-) Transcript_6920:973-1725(-)